MPYMKTLSGAKILVTGGAGFVGSNLVKALVHIHKAQVTVLDNLFTGNLTNLKDLDCNFIHGSVEDENLVEDCVKDVDIVFHLASRNIIVSNKNPREDLNANVRGSFNVFESCSKFGVSRVVYTSTSSIYGAAETIPVKENDKNSFLNFYSASKFCAEVYAHTFHEVFDLPITILRYSNVYGPNQAPVNPYCGVIGNFIHSALLGQPIRIHGDGGQTRDFTYVDDAVNATIAAALCPSALGEDYNIGTGCETSVNGLAEQIVGLLNSPSEIVYVPNRDIDNIRRRAIDISKAKEHLGYSPEFSIAEGLQNTISWFVKANKPVNVSTSQPS